VLLCAYRLYEKLPEVSHKREERTRQAFYAQNRAKAKQFGQVGPNLMTALGLLF
jgi:hypothetical protein